VPRRYSVLQDWMTDLGIQGNPVLEEVGCGLNSSLRLAGSFGWLAGGFDVQSNQKKTYKNSEAG